MKAVIYNYTTWIPETNPKILCKEFEDLLMRSDFQILNFIEHYFQPQGYTALWLLAESHFAIHTFPEENKTYIELSSCDKTMYDDFLLNFNEWINLSENVVPKQK